MLDEGELRQAIADEKMKPEHVKERAGTYYVKKAVRLAAEKQYIELAMKKKAKEQDPNNNDENDSVLGVGKKEHPRTS